MNPTIQKIVLWLLNLTYFPHAVCQRKNYRGSKYYLTNKACTKFRDFGSKIWEDWDNGEYTGDQQLKVVDPTSVTMELISLVIDEKVFRPISRTKLNIWYFFNYQANPLTFFLRALHKRLSPWNLVNNSGKFALAPSIDYPLMIGDEMCINDPIIPLDDPNDVWYGYAHPTTITDLPKHPSTLKHIWDKAIAITKGLPEKTRSICPTCAPKPGGWGNGMLNGQICPTCFGLSTIYYLGKQTEFGTKFREGLTLTREAGRLTNISFTSEALANFTYMYERFGGGIGAAGSFFDSISASFGKYLLSTFPDGNIYTADRRFFTKTAAGFVDLETKQLESAIMPHLANLLELNDTKRNWILQFRLIQSLYELHK